MSQTMMDLAPGQPPMEAPREVVLASAGAGKTFHISSRIIALLAHGEEPEGILASTFTRKAAGEILRRVLDRMAEAAISPEKARELSAYTTLSAERSPPAEPGFWGEQLERVVRVLHRMSVSTLDAFFVGAARTFAHELHLPPGWSIVDDPTARRLRSDALQQLLDTADEGEVVELLRLVHQGEVRRSVHDLLLDDLEKLLLIQGQLDPEAEDPWGAFDEVDPGGPPPTPEEREALAVRIEVVEAPLTKSGGPRKNWVKALANAATAIREEDWEAFVCLTLCQRALEEDPVFDREEIAPEVCSLVGEGVVLARRALRGPLARRVKALGRLTRDFARIYWELQAREGAYRFEDVTRMLGELDPFEGGAALYYRLDARTRHILLDEFQDTSLPQWNALAPLVDEVLQDPARSGVIVADPTQSIYGWRGGEPGLVHGVRDRYGMADAVLAKSYRSSPVVLDLVNRVFSAMEENPALAGNDDCAAAARRWQEDFVPHEAAKKELPGYVRVEAGPRDEGRGSVRPLLCRCVAERVREMRAEAPGARIGVLTRTNATVSRLMMELRKAGVPVSGEGGTALTDSAPCEAILALLRLADHPADRIARYHVACSPLGSVVEMADPGDHGAAARAGRRIRAELVGRGYGATVNWLAKGIADACDARERRRLGQLVEMAHRYEDRATLRPGDFVRLVESERVEDPSTAQVRVMTVHQAKGLEFEIVVLPDLDQPLYRAGGSSLPLPYRPSPTAAATAVYPAVKKDLRPLFPEIEEARTQVTSATVRDGLSTFYVALTRAEHAVHVILQEDGPTGPGSALSAARILREALKEGEALRPAVAGEVLYERGDRDWYRTRGRDEDEAPAATGEETATEPSVTLGAGRARRRLLPRRSPSQLEGGSRVRIADVLRLESGTALERGSVVHAWFEEIEWIEDGLPSDDELRDLARLHGPNMDEPVVTKLIAEFRAWCNTPAIRRSLSRGTYRPDAVVERESPFVMRDEDVLMEGIIDRLVLVRDGDRVVSAEILDFKTDRVADDPGKLAERAKHYAPQMAAYRRAAAHMYGIDESAVTAKLLFVEAGVVHEVAR